MTEALRWLISVLIAMAMALVTLGIAFLFAVFPLQQYLSATLVYLAPDVIGVFIVAPFLAWICVRLLPSLRLAHVCISASLYVSGMAFAAFDAKRWVVDSAIFVILFATSFVFSWVLLRRGSLKK